MMWEVYSSWTNRYNLQKVYGHLQVLFWIACLCFLGLVSLRLLVNFEHDKGGFMYLMEIM